MARIDYYFSLLSPFTYLAGLELERIAERHAAEIAYRPFDIMTVFSETGGVPVAKRHPARLAYREQDLKRLARRAGFDFNLKPKHWPTDPALASGVVLAVASKADDNEGDDAGALAHGLLKAVWARDLDIAEADTIRNVLDDLGMDKSLVSEGRDHLEEYRSITREAIDRGVFGSPFYIVGDEKFWGQDRLDALDWHLSRL